MGHSFTHLNIISTIILLEQPLLFTYKWISHFDLMNHRELFVNSLMSWHTIDNRQESQCDSWYNTRYNGNNALQYDKVNDVLPTITIPSQQFCWQSHILSNWRMQSSPKKGKVLECSYLWYCGLSFANFELRWNNIQKILLITHTYAQTATCICPCVSSINKIKAVVRNSLSVLQNFAALH